MNRTESRIAYWFLCAIVHFEIHLSYRNLLYLIDLTFCNQFSCGNQFQDSGKNIFLGGPKNSVRFHGQFSGKKSPPRALPMDSIFYFRKITGKLHSLCNKPATFLV